MRRACLILFLLSYPILSYGQDSTVQQARIFATTLLSQAKLPGLSIAVSLGDSLVWSEGFGYANVTHRIPVTSSTRFRIGSVTKLLTATAAARLAQDGRLDLDAPIQRYVPSFPDKGRTITIRQLLGHLSGIRHYGRGEFLNTHPYQSVREALTVFQNDSLLFAPGTNYRYTSYGYVLASAAIEKAAGKDFLTFLREDLTDPLSLTSISPDYNDTSDVSQAIPYSLDSLGNFVLSPYNDNSIRWAAGGFLSTADDLVRFGGALLTDRFLNADMRKNLFTSQTTSNDKQTGVGLGWRIAKDSLGIPYFHHGGESIGGRAILLINPDSKVVVAILANLTFARFGEKQALELARMFTK